MKFISIVIGLLLTVNVCRSEWDSSVSFGSSLNQGNTDSLSVDIKAQTKQTTTVYCISFSIRGCYAIQKTDEMNQFIESENNANGKIKYKKYNKLDRKYIYIDQSMAMDKMADIDFRIITAVGLGYIIIEKPNVKINFEFGPAYIAEQKGINYNNHISGRCEISAKEKIKNLTFSQNYELLFIDSDDFFFTAIAGMETKITKHSSLGIEIVDRYDNEPVFDAERNDLSIKALITYNF